MVLCVCHPFCGFLDLWTEPLVPSLASSLTPAPSPTLAAWASVLILAAHGYLPAGLCTCSPLCLEGGPTSLSTITFQPINMLSSVFSAWQMITILSCMVVHAYNLSRRLRQEDCEFEASLGSTMTSRIASATLRRK